MIDTTLFPKRRTLFRVWISTFLVWELLSIAVFVLNPSSSSFYGKPCVSRLLLDSTLMFCWSVCATINFAVSAALLRHLARAIHRAGLSRGWFIVAYFF